MAYVLIILFWGVVDADNNPPPHQEEALLAQVPVASEEICRASAAQVRAEYGVRHAFCVRVR